MLTEFFTTNAAIKEGPKYLYSEFPEHFVWHEKLKKWKGRNHGVLIGRVAHASPGEGERYYLRLLLAHVRGPTSFDDILTVNDVYCVSFQEAALKRGILEQYNAAEQCMDEAIQVEMPNALRRLFATILIFGCPENPAEFWEQYYIPLSDDFRKQFPGQTLKILYLTAETKLQSTRDISDAMNSPVPLLQLASLKDLNVRQRAAYKTIIQNVKGNKAGAFFIDGPGGTGKTFLYGALYSKQEAVEASIVSSPIWLSLTKFSLTENIRAREDPKFAEFLLRLGNGELQTVASSLVQLPPHIMLEESGEKESEQDLIDAVFPEIQQSCFNPDIFNVRVILTPCNADVHCINSALIEKFSGPKHVYHSFDSVVDDNSNVYPAEFLNSLCSSGMTPHQLVLKDNSPVIITEFRPCSGAL
ncbi:uncharacterized protein LOC141590145 [Silene latifolia]|uniref:uncharacterized protein LOC141590145 n=1 Tax=Silene latifolia TaxID=37657 RepID=UPI003D76C19B